MNMVSEETWKARAEKAQERFQENHIALMRALLEIDALNEKLATAERRLTKLRDEKRKRNARPKPEAEVAAVH